MKKHSILVSSATMLLLMTVPITGHADCVDDLFAKYSDPHTKSLNRVSFEKMRQDPEYQRCASRASSSLTGAPSNAARTTPPGTVTAEDPASNPSKSAFGKPLLLLRRDFSDIGLFSTPSEIAEAHGAEFSVTSDRITQNTTWAVNANGSVVFQHPNNSYGPKNKLNFIGFSLAPYVQIDLVSNTSTSAKLNNVDMLGGGGSAEIGFDIPGGGAHYFRGRAAAVLDRIDNTTSGSAVFEWIPVYDRLLNSPFKIFNIPVVFVFGPELKLRYDNIIVNDTTSAKDYLWRTGPQLTLRYKLFGSNLPWYLQCIHGQTTYTWLIAPGTNQTFSYLDTSLSYNIDKDGHVALTGTYTKGSDEQTGRQFDIWKVGLTTKW